MQFKGKALRLADLGEISDEAKASLDHFDFERVAAPGTLLCNVRLEWLAGGLSGSDAVIVTDESLDLNTSTIFPDLDDFILWLEEVYDDREK